MHPRSLAANPVPRISARRALRLAGLTIAGSLLMAISAKATVPFWPVPMTMQVFGVLLLAALAGGRLATAMMALYLLEGAVGLPVFAGTAPSGIGLAALLGPTGGYLIGFAAAAFVAGTWIERAKLRGSLTAILPMLLGLAIIYLCGAAWLAQFVGWPHVLATGVLPFLPGDLLKVALAAAIAAAWSRAVRRA